jgi:hypothetical protein
LAAPYQPNTSKRNLHIGTEFEAAEPESYEFAGESHPIGATREQTDVRTAVAVQHLLYLEDRLAKPFTRVASLPD